MQLYRAGFEGRPCLHLSHQGDERLPSFEIELTRSEALELAEVLRRQAERLS